MPPAHDLPEDLAPAPIPPQVTFMAEFGLGAVVHLKLRGDELPGMVTAVTFRPCGFDPLYEVSWGDGDVDTRYEVELCREFSPRY